MIKKNSNMKKILNTKPQLSRILVYFIEHSKEILFLPKEDCRKTGNLPSESETLVPRQ